MVPSIDKKQLAQDFVDQYVITKPDSVEYDAILALNKKLDIETDEHSKNVLILSFCINANAEKKVENLFILGMIALYHHADMTKLGRGLALEYVAGDVTAEIILLIGQMGKDKVDNPYLKIIRDADLIDNAVAKGDYSHTYNHSGDELAIPLVIARTLNHEKLSMGLRVEDNQETENREG